MHGFNKAVVVCMCKYRHNSSQSLFYLIFFVGLRLIEVKAYSLLYVQGTLVAMLRGPYGVMRIKQGSYCIIALAANYQSLMEKT